MRDTAPALAAFRAESEGRAFSAESAGASVFFEAVYFAMIEQRSPSDPMKAQSRIPSTAGRAWFWTMGVASFRFG
jgi:hypothetical protein